MWPGRVVFPDFTNVSITVPWFKDGVKYFRNVENIPVDGLWVVGTSSVFSLDINHKRHGGAYSLKFTKE